MSDDQVALDTLYAGFEAVRDGHATGDGWKAHVALLDRLAADRRAAEAWGWTSCALERHGNGPFRLWGIPPSGRQRELVPDWPR
jgi:hypothetical protein